jgi:glycosyltransferase involved in cell wall biosynthesis
VRDRVPVSVIIPAYNAEAFVGEAIVSVLDQTYPPEEIILVDDGSTDATTMVATRFAEVTVIPQDNAGPGSARNTGLRHASRPFVAFLDADDLWPSDKLERQFSRMAPPLRLVFGMAVEFRDRDKGGVPKPLRPKVRCQLPGAMLAPRELFDRVGLFRERPRIGDVIDWFARAVDAGIAMEMTDDVALYRRLHADNLGRQASNAAADYLNVVRGILHRRRADPSEAGPAKSPSKSP